MNAPLARSMLLVGMLWTGTTDAALAQGSTVLFTASPKISCFGMDEDTHKLVKDTGTGADAIALLTATTPQPRARGSSCTTRSSAPSS
jgi:hypothetical protein